MSNTKNPAEPLPNVAPVHSEAVGRRAKIAEHESGHTIVTDHYGWGIEWVNIQDGTGKPRMMKANWGEFEAALAKVNWNDTAQRDAMRSRVLDYVTTLVAGHLAEKGIDPTEQLISERLKQHQELLKQPPDRTRTGTARQNS
jgi:hypothetical protein